MDKDTVRLIIGLAFFGVVLWIVAGAVASFDVGTLAVVAVVLVLLRRPLKWLW